MIVHNSLLPIEFKSSPHVVMNSVPQQRDVSPKIPEMCYQNIAVMRTLSVQPLLLPKEANHGSVCLSSYGYVTVVK